MVKDFLAFRSISAGRRLRVLSQLGALVGDEPALLADIQAAEAANQHSRATDKAWKKQDPGKLRRRKGRTSELDPALDRRLTSIRNFIQTQIELCEPDNPKVKALQALLESFFPFGLRAVTRSPFEEELVAVLDLIAEAERPEFAPLVESIQLKEPIARLKLMADDYRKALDEDQSGVPFSSVLEARTQAAESYAVVLVGLLFASRHKPEQRAAWMRPHLAQITDVSGYVSRGRLAPDVDPSTGETVPDDAAIESADTSADEPST